MALGNGDKKLSELKRDIIIIDRNLPIPLLFEQLIESRNHMALVVNGNLHYPFAIRMH